MRRSAFILFLLAAGCSRGPAPEAAAPAATTLAAATDRTFTSGGVTLRYREFGRGDPVILIHGFGGQIEAWGTFGDSLALSHRVIALDVRGHGQSDKPTAPGSYGPRMAGDVIALLDHLRIRRAHLVGHSMGAVIAAFVSVRHLDRVRSASLIAGPFYADSVTAIREVGRFADDMEQGRGYTAFLTWIAPGMPAQAAARIAAEIAAENDPPRMAPIFRSIAGLMNREAPARAIPAFFVVGTNDPLDSLSAQLHGRWRAAALVRIEGAGHVDVLMRPQTLAGIRQTLREGQ